MEMNVKMNVIKRNGKEVPFDITKIVNAIGKANNEVDHVHQMNDYQIRAVADNIAHKIAGYSHAYPMSKTFRIWSKRASWKCAAMK